MINKLCDELDERAKNNVSVFKKGAKRILLTGTPYTDQDAEQLKTRIGAFLEMLRN